MARERSDPPAPPHPGGREFGGRQCLSAARHRAHPGRKDGGDREHATPEGRLILCDALTEADSEKPDLLLGLRHADRRGARRAGPRAAGAVLRRRRRWPPDCCRRAPRSAIRCGACRFGGPYRKQHRRQVRRSQQRRAGHLRGIDHRGAVPGRVRVARPLAGPISTSWRRNTAARPGRPEGGEATGMRALYAYSGAAIREGRRGGDWRACCRENAGFNPVHLASSLRGPPCRTRRSGGPRERGWRGRRR